MDKVTRQCPQTTTFLRARLLDSIDILYCGRFRFLAHGMQFLVKDNGLTLVHADSCFGKGQWLDTGTY